MDCKDMKNTLDEQLNEILKLVQIQLAKKRILSDEAQQVGAKHNNLYGIKGGKK